MRPRFPFTAIIGQNALKTALQLAAIDPTIGGVLAFGDRGTGKSTALRALASVLPRQTVTGCAYRCDPAEPASLCDRCRAALARDGTLAHVETAVPVVDMPLGASEDRIAGGLDLEHAMIAGERRFQPGLLARAHRGFLYVDEINLLADHLVDLLLDVAASGENVVERDGLGIRHPARFVLIGSGNPEEGELRPQLLDRFGLSVGVETPADIGERVAIVQAREAFERDPAGFVAAHGAEQEALSRRLSEARTAIAAIELDEPSLRQAASLCARLGTDGLRAELTLMRAARAHAALQGRNAIEAADLRLVAPMVLSHRLRRDPLDEAGSEARVERAVAEIMAA